ncbi:uncharacterized protein LOC110249913 [Exaiptasia diaphana]|uniref:Uncharacterized protein n=1 Tax=Exaiptasia diaphana TaxID=2652724 RepID=A0A913YW13_EXADI|nr:uncharacterized protein LOC110249913 [Exaiptasia diaphana]
MADEKEQSDCSPLISVKGFKDMIYRQLSVDDLERNRYEASYSELSEEMGISMETIGELDEVCSPSNLKSELQPDDLDDVDIYGNDLPESVSLSSLRLLKERKGKLTHFKREINYEIKETKIADSKTKRIPVEKVEVVLSVAIHHPRRV